MVMAAVSMQSQTIVSAKSVLPQCQVCQENIDVIISGQLTTVILVPLGNQTKPMSVVGQDLWPPCCDPCQDASSISIVWFC